MQVAYTVYYKGMISLSLLVLQNMNCLEFSFALSHAPQQYPVTLSLVSRNVYNGGTRLLACMQVCVFQQNLFEQEIQQKKISKKVKKLVSPRPSELSPRVWLDINYA